MLFCDKLQQLRRNAKLTQDEFAVHIGISRQAISKWESGVAYPDLKNLQIICKFFNISPDLLLNDKRDLSDTKESFYHFDLTDLGNNIRKVRLARSIGQENLAEMLGVSRQSVSKWENGMTVPKTELLLNIMKELNTDLRELLPPAPLLDESASPQVEENADTCPKESPNLAARNRKKPRRLWVIIPLLTLLLAFLTVGAILTIPMMTADPFDTLFTDLFFDIDEVNGVLERWEKEGVEITLGDGENAITAKVQISDTAITIANLSPQPVTLPRQNATTALEASDFHYSRYSPKALSYDQYNSLMSFLEIIEKEPNNVTTTDGLTETLKNILDASSETLSPKVQYGLADGRFALEKNVTVTANASQLSSLLTTIADEVKKNEELNGILESLGLSDEYSEAPQKLDVIIREIRKEMISNYKSKNITLTYTVTGGNLTRITLSDQSTDKDKIKYDTSVVFTAYSDNNPTGFSMNISNKTTYDGISDTLETEYIYKRIETDSKADLTLTVESRSIMENDSGSQSYTSKETHTLNYDKKAKTFSYRHKIPELEFESKIQGVWEFDGSNGFCRFGILKWIEGDTKILDASSAILSVRALGSEALPVGEELFSMSNETWIALYRQLPLKKVEAIYKDITKSNPGFVFTKQGEPVLAATQTLAKRYTEALRKYATGQEAQNFSAPKIRFYSDVYDLHILLTYQSSGNVTVTYTNLLTEAEITNFHEATLKNGMLDIHHTEKTRRQEPTCTQDGKQYYKCTDCEKEYFVTISKLDHQYLSQTMSIIADNGEKYIASYPVCSRCNDTFQVWITKDGTQNSTKWCSFFIESSAGGGYTVVDYATLHNHIYFSIPDAVVERLSINTLRLFYSYNYKLIRIPSGIKTLNTNTGFQSAPQVLILPASLTEISNGAFSNSASLHTIYYSGTEAQWNKVKLNRYRDEWKDVNVIFCPEGVSPEIAASSCLFLEETQATVLANANKQTESADAAITFAQNDGAHLIESGIIKNVISDRIGNTIAVIGAYTDGKQTVSIYNTENFSLINQITVDFEIGRADAWDGLVALSTADSSSVNIYRQSDGNITNTFIPFADKTEALRELFIIDGYVYYSNMTAIYIYTLKENTIQLFHRVARPSMVINRSLHRLAIASTQNSPSHLWFLDTQSAEKLAYYQFSPDYPWTEEFPYLTQARHSPTEYYDPSGNLLKENPSIKAVTLTQKRNESFISCVVQTNRLNVSVYYDTSKTVYLQVKTADGEQQKVDYYAKNAILLSNGTLLLYTQDGYGLVAVTL